VYIFDFGEILAFSAFMPTASTSVNLAHLLQFPATLVQALYGPTKVVTLEAGSVAEKEFPPT
jgi:hypothetical protein